MHGCVDAGGAQCAHDSSEARELCRSAASGRIRELIEMRKLKTAAIGWVVVDEADRLLIGESLRTIS